MNNDELKNKINNMSVDDLKAEVFRLTMAEEAHSQANTILEQKATRLTLELDLRKKIAESDEKLLNDARKKWGLEPDPEVNYILTDIESVEEYGNRVFHECENRRIYFDEPSTKETES